MGCDRFIDQMLMYKKETRGRLPHRFIHRCRTLRRQHRRPGAGTPPPPAVPSHQLTALPVPAILVPAILVPAILVPELHLTAVLGTALLMTVLPVPAELVPELHPAAVLVAALLSTALSVPALGSSGSKYQGSFCGQDEHRRTPAQCYSHAVTH